MAMKIDPGTPGWQQRHVELYLESDGAEGHVLDFSRPCVPEVHCLAAVAGLIEFVSRFRSLAGG